MKSFPALLLSSAFCVQATQYIAEFHTYEGGKSLRKPFFRIFNQYNECFLTTKKFSCKIYDTTVSINALSLDEEVSEVFKNLNSEERPRFVPYLQSSKELGSTAIKPEFIDLRRLRDGEKVYRFKYETEGHEDDEEKEAREKDDAFYRKQGFVPL